MAVVNVVDQENTVVDEISLSDDVFGVEVRPELLNQVVKAHLAAKRVGTASVKTRSTIRGGGRKPWRQKGTGRARAGSVRSPLWTGGAITHGPNPDRNFRLKINKKVKRLALRMALSSKLAAGELTVISKLELQRPKTKDFDGIRRKLQLDKALVVVGQKDDNLELASRNIPNIRLVGKDQINVYDILLYPQLVVTPEVIETLEERLR
jgi:large subunit ribosomal protein L4